MLIRDYIIRLARLQGLVRLQGLARLQDLARLQGLACLQGLARLQGLAFTGLIFEKNFFGALTLKRLLIVWAEFDLYLASWHGLASSQSLASS